MKKSDVLDLHEQMVTIKDSFEQMSEVPEDAFESYEDEVSPSDVGRSMEAHKRAVFVLGRELADVMSEDEFSDAGRIKNRMDELAADVSA